MFHMMPLERSDFRNTLREWERDFLKGFVSTGHCRTDIREEPSRYVLECEMPGLQKKDIRIDMDGNILTLCAGYQKEMQKKQEGSYIRRERTKESCCRRFDISGIQTDAIEATYQDGILTLMMPKLSAQKANSRRIEVQ